MLRRIGLPYGHQRMIVLLALRNQLYLLFNLFFDQNGEEWILLIHANCGAILPRRIGIVSCGRRRNTRPPKKTLFPRHIMTTASVQVLLTLLFYD